jgi:hypothetical protein
MRICSDVDYMLQVDMLSAKVQEANEANQAVLASKTEVRNRILWFVMMDDTCKIQNVNERFWCAMQLNEALQQQQQKAIEAQAASENALKDVKEQLAIVQSDLSASVADVAATKDAVSQLEGQLVESRDDGIATAERLDAAHDNLAQLKQVSHTVLLKMPIASRMPSPMLGCCLPAGKTSYCVLCRRWKQTGCRGKRSLKHGSPTSLLPSRLLLMSRLNCTPAMQLCANHKLKQVSATRPSRS